jgi:hypothetical protein
MCYQAPEVSNHHIQAKATRTMYSHFMPQLSILLRHES